MIKCFVVNPTGQAQVYLRRYSSGSKCSESGYGYHNAEAMLDKRPLQLSPEGYVSALPVDKTDSRWPVRCKCGYEFTDEDMWQCNQEELYSDGTDEWRNRDLPVGAMFEVTREWPWYWPGDDGKVWTVVTPGGQWVIDGRASNGPENSRGWNRTGIAPDFRVTPSIQCGPYHGYLGGSDGQHPGYLVEC